MPTGERRQYNGAAAQTTLNGAITAGATTVVVQDATNWPDGSVGPFFIAVDPGLAAEEKIKCVSRTGNTITVVTSPSSGRGADGTSAISHVSGAVVQHVLSADDADKWNAHINDLNDNHQSLLNTTRHDTTTRHPLGSVISTGTPGTSSPGDAAAAGVSTSAARADHTHGRESFATPSIALGTAAGAGVAGTIIRSDATIAAFDATVPTTSAVGDTAAVGTAVVASRRDHTHGREGFAAPVASNPGDAQAAGSAATIPRSDHKHAREKGTAVGSTEIGGTPAAGKVLYPQVGSSTVTTSGAGGFAITLPNAYGTGLATVILILGDVLGGTTQGVVVPLAANHTLSAIQGICFDMNHAALANTTIRVNFVVWGWD